MRAALLPVLLAVAGAAHAGPPELLWTQKCLTCHAVEKRLVGPSFREIAAKYAGDSEGEKKIVRKISKGGYGAWGPIPMPDYPQLTYPEVRQLAHWVLEQR